MKALRFWISWVQRTDDYRSFTFPPKESILGWWCSGYDADEKAILCAVVEAKSVAAAWLAVHAEWPEAERSNARFCEVKSSDFVPGDRFPLSDWMKARFDK